MTADPTHVDRFVEQLGYLAEGEGLPRTAGRMMGVLITSGTPLGIDELATRLKVSRASVSTNSRLLQSLAIAQLVVEPGSRRDYLQISGDPSSSLLTLGLRRMQSMRQAIREMRLALRGTRLDLTGMRLKRMEEFYDTAIAHAQLVLRKWRKHEQDGVGLVGVNAGALGAAGRRRKRDRVSRRARGGGS